MLRRSLFKLMPALPALFAAVALSLLTSPAAQAAGGPIVLMGIDAEDGGPGGHGPISSYVGVVRSVYNAASNGGLGILVVGGNKSATDNVTRFWNAISVSTGFPVTYVNGSTNITARSFSGFRMIAIVSSASDTPSGGLTSAENTALGGRRVDAANFVNAGYRFSCVETDVK